jgi:hypothetical protein
VGVHRRPVHGLIARPAGPGSVSAAVPEARLVADQDLVGTEPVPVLYLAPSPADVLILAIVCQVMSVVYF